MTAPRSAALVLLGPGAPREGSQKLLHYLAIGSLETGYLDLLSLDNSFSSLLSSHFKWREEVSIYLGDQIISHIWEAPE